MTAPHPRLADDRAMWERKPALRAVYSDYFRRLARACRPGRTLEIGGGSGRLKEFMGDVISSDVQEAPWLDLVADGQRLPFSAGSLENIVLLDALHHIEAPRLFFAEAVRVLKPGGRIALIEPAITPLSHLAYGLFHPEPVDMSQDPLARPEPAQGRDPYDANQAIPTLLFRHGAARFAREFPALEIREARLLSLFAYPLSGGFRGWSLIPGPWVGPLLKIEALIAPLLGPLLAFRLFAAIERR